MIFIGVVELFVASLQYLSRDPDPIPRNMRSCDFKSWPKNGPIMNARICVSERTEPSSC